MQAKKTEIGLRTRMNFNCQGCKFFLFLGQLRRYDLFTFQIVDICISREGSDRYLNTE